mgnify:CR=1 FL=1
MEKLRIIGGKKLAGRLSISGSKNAALPILAASLLATKPVALSRVPHLRDVTTMISLLGSLGSDVLVDDKMRVNVLPSALKSLRAPYDLVKTMRASFVVLGPLLTRYGRAEVSLPGGCAIGARPVDQHIKGLESLGANINVEDGYVRAEAQHGLRGNNFCFDVVTVGGTQNLMMAAVMAEGVTRLENCACEPEVEDLGNFLNTMGAKISGLGSSLITIEGVSNLGGCSYSIMADRVEAGTYLIAAAITRGKVRLDNISPLVLRSVTDKLVESGAKIDTGEAWIELDMRNRRPVGVDIETAPYPGFPTDMQAQYLALNSIADGTSMIREKIFENRFMHVQELCRLGANIRLLGPSSAIVEGVANLRGAPVMATDLRASFSLVVAALAAEGETIIDRIYHIDRGYETIEEKLRLMGAEVSRFS